MMTQAETACTPVVDGVMMDRARAPRLVHGSKLGAAGSRAATDRLAHRQALCACFGPPFSGGVLVASLARTLQRCIHTQPQHQRGRPRQPTWPSAATHVVNHNTHAGDQKRSMIGVRIRVTAPNRGLPAVLAGPRTQTRRGKYSIGGSTQGIN
jgi:hypothetical protein